MSKPRPAVRIALLVLIVPTVQTFITSEFIELKYFFRARKILSRLIDSVSISIVYTLPFGIF